MIAAIIMQTLVFFFSLFCLWVLIVWIAENDPEIGLKSALRILAALIMWGGANLVITAIIFS